MEEGDHSQCSIELLACPEHRGEQLRKIAAMGANNPPAHEVETQSTMFTDEEGKRTFGFCLWCNQDFYSMAEVEEHNANDMQGCSVFQELKDEDCGPPVLCQMLQNSRLSDQDGSKKSTHRRSSRQKPRRTNK